MGTVIRRTCDEYTREPLDMMDMILIERSARVIVMVNDDDDDDSE